MSSTASEIIGVGSNASLTIPLPDGATREPDDALPTIDLSNLPGARLAARLGYASASMTVRVVCVAAPASGWAPGVEEIVLGRASQLAKEALGEGVTSFLVGERVALGGDERFEQSFQGLVRRRDANVAVRGRHWLGFAGEPREAIVCTAACIEPEPARACDALIAGVAPTGAWLGAPPPNLLARTLLLAAGSPWHAMVAVAMLSIAVATLIIVKRPRPRP